VNELIAPSTRTGEGGEQRKAHTIRLATHGCDCTPAARQCGLSCFMFCLVDFLKDEGDRRPGWEDCARSISHRPHRPPTGSGLIELIELSDSLAGTRMASVLASRSRRRDSGKVKLQHKSKHSCMIIGSLSTLWRLFSVSGLLFYMVS
jgi:hypothetical protein